MTKPHSITNRKNKQPSETNPKKGPPAKPKTGFHFQMNAAADGLYINASGTGDDSGISNIWETKQIGIIK